MSNQHDTKNNIVLGQAQVSVHRVDGVEYLTLCHHPPDWLQDQDAVISHLESKVRMQLFGHKHSQRVQEINKTLRVTSGAMHPERDESGWEPMYIRPAFRKLAAILDDEKDTRPYLKSLRRAVEGSSIGTREQRDALLEEG